MKKATLTLAVGLGLFTSLGLISRSVAQQPAPPQQPQEAVMVFRGSFTTAKVRGGQGYLLQAGSVVLRVPSAEVLTIRTQRDGISVTGLSHGGAVKVPLDIARMDVQVVAGQTTFHDHAGHTLVIARL